MKKLIQSEIWKRQGLKNEKQSNGEGREREGWKGRNENSQTEENSESEKKHFRRHRLVPYLDVVMQG